jgi:iron complex outermembrane receptor protein
MTVVRRISFALLMIVFAAVAAAADKPPARDLSNLSVDDLMNVEVTSVARRGQKLSDTPAAVFVITQDDIQRSGATSIPDVLRMVPGLDVAEINGGIWAVSARGFNSRGSNKLLVLIDGRTVYSPVFSGVFWDVEDTALEDIDRIEVIRGPGGTLWGANAVNGIINIITRHSLETQGALVSVAQGSNEHALTTAQYGGSAGDDLHFRVFGKSFDRPGTGAVDRWRGERGGFRADWTASPRDNVFVQGEMFRGSREESFGFYSPSDPLHGARDGRYRLEAGDAVLRWTQTQSTRSESTLQVYTSAATHDSEPLTTREHAFGVDFQHQIGIGSRNTVVWGLGYRRDFGIVQSALDMIDLESGPARSDLFSAFVQDEVRLPHTVSVTFGSKVERRHGFSPEFQPTIRALWRPNDRHVLWSAVTNAVRTPTWVELDSRINIGAFPDPAGGQSSLLVLFGNGGIRPERSTTYEAGYRWLSKNELSLDVATFYSHLRNLVASEPGSPYLDAGGAPVFPLVFENAGSGSILGLELLATTQLTTRWELSGGYSLLHLHQEGVNLSQRASTEAPAQQAQLRSALTVLPRLELDTSVYYVGRLRLQGIPGYVRVDSRLAWHPRGPWELSIVGQNLFDRQHREFVSPDVIPPASVRRSIYGRVTWRFR